MSYTVGSNALIEIVRRSMHFEPVDDAFDDARPAFQIEVCG
jgi:hypothetical protein